MKETPLSNCERDFILKAIAERKRLDGRQIYDYRQLQITYGVDRGSCQVTLGNTRVLAQVSCEVTAPKQNRPAEGILFINVELSPMASPQFEAGRQSEEGVELTRLLERCLKESRCVDTESLCIMSGIKVWQVRCDLHILNHDGNLLDCSSVAAIAALAHFRRPDVTVSGEDVTIHSLEDRDPLPLSIHHMPLCVTFAFYHQGKFLLVDASEREERVMEGKLVIGMNKHREVCTLQMTGSMLLLKDQVLRCSNIAFLKVKDMTKLIQEALENDVQARAQGKKFGFASSVDMSKDSANRKEAISVPMDTIEARAHQIIQEGNEESSEDFIDSDDQDSDGDVGDIGEGGTNTWVTDQGEDEDMTEELAQEDLDRQQVMEQPKNLSAVSISSDSEEEQTTTLGVEDLQIAKKHRPSSKKETAIDLPKALKGEKKKKSQLKK